MNDRDKREAAAYKKTVKLVLALFALLLLTAAAPIESGPVRLCPTLAPSAACRPVDLDAVRPSGSGVTLVRTVTVDPEAMPLSRPLMVWVTALASSEVRWNGVVIGRNGVPASDRAGERPGRFVATFVVPDRLVRAGDNLLSVRMSAHHLWLPVRTPIHLIEVGPYETPALPGLSHYLPALLMLGALAAALIYFTAAAFSERGDSGARLLALIAGSATLQLLAEVSRTFVAYSYPWHLVRVGGIALLAALTAVLVAAYAAHRFAPRRRRAVIAATAVAAAASVLLIPWFDLKAIGAIAAGMLALAMCAFLGLRERRRGAAAAFAAALVILAVMAAERTMFLDRTYFICLATALVALVAEQVRSLRRARAERDAEARRATALAERLARAEREGEPVLALKDGSRTHRVAESDILYVRATDDYCDVTLKGGRTLLVTQNLARFLGTLPGRFIRVHKSYAVNRTHVIAVAQRSGGGKELTLSEGQTVPVGRSYAAALAALTASEGATSDDLAAARRVISPAEPEPARHGR